MKFSSALILAGALQHVQAGRRHNSDYSDSQDDTFQNPYEFAKICYANYDADGVGHFKFQLEVWAAETGYFRVEGCEGVNPTLVMQRGTKYVFDQSGYSNWMHPLGFAYGPDGAFKGNPELEEPIYKLDDTVIGLDTYESVWFTGKRDLWIGAGKFSVELTVSSDVEEIFYFCHVHDLMSARIKVVDSWQVSDYDVLNSVLIPIPYDYDVLSEFDYGCGTHNVTQYQEGQNCPGMTFLCDETPDEFHQCMVAIDCAMHVEMRTTGNSDPGRTFMWQMVPHHRNAVNMAKIMLKFNPRNLWCDENDASCVAGDPYTDDSSEMINMMWEIVNGQNAQMTMMRHWLYDRNENEFNYCPANEEEDDGHCLDDNDWDDYYRYKIGNRRRNWASGFGGFFAGFCGSGMAAVALSRRSKKTQKSSNNNQLGSIVTEFSDNTPEQYYPKSTL